MYKATFTLLTGLLLSLNGFCTANSVYHEFTMNSVGGGCGIFVNTTTPVDNSPLTVQFTIDFQYFTNQARIYYTTDGSAPSGALGVPSGTTQVIVASYVCTFNNGSGVVDVARGTIPGLPTGTVVKYIVSAWHSGGGLEIFASGGSNTSSATATVFNYTVSSVLPLTITGFSAKKELNTIKLNWSVESTVNTAQFEIYSSGNGSDFKNIGIIHPAQNIVTGSDYHYTDAYPLTGPNFYKIKVVEKDGHIYFTPVIKVSFETNRPSPISINGNILHISLNATQKEFYSVTLVNNCGQTLRRWTISATAGAGSYDLDLPTGIIKGLYHISARGNRSQVSRTLMIR
jgi:hypothetical protein